MVRQFCPYGRSDIVPNVVETSYQREGVISGKFRMTTKRLWGATDRQQIVAVAEFSVQQHCTSVPARILQDFLTDFVVSASKSADFVVLKDIPAHLIAPIAVFLGQIGVKAMSLEYESDQIGMSFYRCGLETITLRSA